MPSGHGLLDRLRQSGGYTSRSAEPRTEDIKQSIHRHLERMLNTRKGDSPAFPEYGLPALSDVETAARCEEVRRQIERCLREFEPRLAGVRVIYIDPSEDEFLRLRFQIKARSVGLKKKVDFNFDTAVDAVGTGWKVTS